jgi:hypothetical protein
MKNDTHKTIEDAHAVIEVYRGALESAQAEVERLKECIALLRAENPKKKRKERKPAQTFVRTY